MHGVPGEREWDAGQVKCFKRRSEKKEAIGKVFLPRQIT